MTQEPLDIVALFGSYRAERRGIRAVRYVRSRLEGRGHRVAVVDAREVGLPILDRMYKEYPAGAAPESLERLAALYRGADAFVLVAGEYNHSVQPGLKNLLDHFLEEYFFRPSAIVSYSPGGYGGMRVAMHLRAVLGELGMPSIPSILAIDRITRVLDEDGRDAEGGLTRRADRFLAELEWYARALKRQRAAEGTPY